ncbi:MAG TPA: AMP-binding protein, partial [Acidimicrobiales bacterium]|nr:AMP-binding protein [Acidimicrobiales bacterium]
MYAAAHAAEHPDQPAVVMSPSGEVVTYRAFEERANQTAHLLRGAGLRRGDHIAVLSRNSPTMLAVEAAAERTGLYFTLVNSYLSPDEVAYVVDNCRAGVFFAGTSVAEVAEAAARRCPKLERRVVMPDSGLAESGGAPVPGWSRLETLVSDLPTTPIADEQLGAAMLYSSG